MSQGFMFQDLKSLKSLKGFGFAGFEGFEEFHVLEFHVSELQGSRPLSEGEAQGFIV